MVYSGETYTYEARSVDDENYNEENYTFLWEATDGTSSSYTERIFIWTAPVVYEPKNVTILVYVTDNVNDCGCTGKDEIELTVIPWPEGQINLEKSLEFGQDKIKTGDVITYSIIITNTGQTRVVSLPLIDDYPEEFLTPLSSDLPWDQNNESALIWDDLLIAPLDPGRSVTVSISFRAVEATETMIINKALVQGAIDENGVLLESKSAYSITASINQDCPSIGPTVGYAGIPVIFSAPSWIEDCEWIALDANDNPVDSSTFNDTKNVKVSWTPPATGAFTISYNDLLCAHYIYIKEIPSASDLFINKNSDREVYAPGEQVIYSISYRNNLDFKAENITIYDILPDVEYLNAIPEPDYIQGNVLYWHLGTIYARTNGSIEIMVRIKERPDIRFEEIQSVSGVGYIYSRKGLSTGIKPYNLINYANITAFYGRNKRSNSTSATIRVQDISGSEVKTVEHGSGHYEKEQFSRLNTSSRTIRLDKQINATHRPTTFSLPRNRSIDYVSLWNDRTCSKNYNRNEVVSENFLYMETMKSESSFFMDENQTIYSSKGDFSGGKAQLHYTRMHPNTTRKDIEISENYHGDFSIEANLDSYGNSVMYSKHVSGMGFVASDNRKDKAQSSFEYGSGYYESREAMDKATIYKDSNFTYVPNRQTVPGREIGYASKWHERMDTRDKGVKLSERITSASFIKKETLIDGTSLSVSGEFQGDLELKAVRQDNPKDKEMMRVDQILKGSYKIDSTISVHKLPKYVSPHINITKKALKQDENTVLFRINVTNDGNKTLGPVFVTDVLPDGMTFVNSSLRPEVEGQKIKWSILSLQIGGMRSIDLRARLNETESLFINRVNVTASYDGGEVTAEAYCSLILDWLPCCITENVSDDFDNNKTAIYECGGWKPPGCMNLELNISTCSFGQDEGYGLCPNEDCLGLQLY